MKEYSDCSLRRVSDTKQHGNLSKSMQPSYVSTNVRDQSEERSWSLRQVATADEVDTWEGQVSITRAD